MEIKTMIVYEYSEFTNTVYKDTPIWISYIIITRNGKKYLYYKHLNENLQPDGEEHKILKERVEIFDGIRKDIVEKINQWKQAKEKWYEAKKQVLYQFEQEAREIVNQKLKEWEKNNPFPELKL
jgi:hypothetical protein